MTSIKQTLRLRKIPEPQPQALSPLPQGTQTILRTGSEAVAYHIPTSPPSSSNPILKTTISLPRYSKWTSGLHFHTQHTEYLRLIKGAIWVHLNGEEKMISAQAGGEVYAGSGGLKPNGAGLVLEVPKYARHNWQRAEVYYSFRRAMGSLNVKLEDVDEEVVVEEWTDPSDLGKPLFFWNLNGVVTAPADSVILSLPQRIVKAGLMGWWIPFQLFVIFWELDNWPVFLKLRGAMGDLGRLSYINRYVERIVEYAVTFVVLFAAKLLGWLAGVRAVERSRTPEELWEAYGRHDPTVSRRN
jgi:hypothetical protein